MSERFGDAMRKHWFDYGLGIAAVLSLILYMDRDRLPDLQILAILHFITLLFHQFEEYRAPGYFPGFVNVAMYKSSIPDRFPLNTRSALVINVYMGWILFAAGILFYDVIWFGIALSLVSVGNIIAHVVLFNVKGRSLYNPGMATSVLLFLPFVAFYGHNILWQGLVSTSDIVIGSLIGIMLNVAVLAMIAWMKDTATPFIFEARQLKPEARQLRR